MPLVINSNVVNKISGPVSMYILVPKPNDDFPNLPVYMLFGDVHNDSENMCEEEPGVQGQYKIQDIDFLSILSSLGSSQDPIDFYVEGGDFHNKEYDEPFSEKHPMQQLWNLYAECYKHNRRKIAQYEHKTECEKIPNIRWQSGDPRYFDNYSKSASLNCNMKRLLGLVDFRTERKNRHLILLQSAGDFFKQNKGCSKKLLNVKSVKDNISVHTEIDDFKKIVLQKDGLIVKQLKKFKPKQRSIFIQWIKQYCDYSFKDLVDTYRINTYVLEEFRQLHLHCIYYINQYIKSGVIDTDFFNLNLQDDNWKRLMLYYVYLSDKYRILLDLYTICRTFKYIHSKGSNPVMNIVYTGNSHTEGITHFLENIAELYTVKNIQDFNMNDVTYFNKPINRCIDIQLKLDLGNLIDTVNSNRVYADSSSVKRRGRPRGSRNKPKSVAKGPGRPRGSRNKPKSIAKGPGRPRGSRNKPKSVAKGPGRPRGSRNKPKS